MRNNLFLGVAVAALVIPAAASAQETTSAIRGTVTSGGAPVAGAQITIVNVPSGTRSTATTDDKGAFNVTGLRVGGPYTVSVASPSGSTDVTDIFTDVGQPYDVPIELAAAGNTKEIVITASTIARAGSVSQGPATVLNSKDIANIATTNRDIRDLARRDPFARLDDTPGGGRAVSFAGQNARFNKFSVDGVPITDNFGLNPDGLPSRRSPIPLDAIGQFQTKVAPYDVREGNFQGGAINIILRSGGNSFQGTGFYSVTGDGVTGKETKAGPGVPTGVVTLPRFKSEDYGVELSGPIIKDKLFFMVAGERIRAGTPIPEGPSDNNAGTAIPGLTQAMVDTVVAVAKSKYNYDAGGVLNNSADSDDRIVAKLDANISETQRASLTYSYTKDSIQFNQNTFTTPPPGLGLSSDGYISSNRLHTGVFQLNSDWSDEFSTEARAFLKDYKRGQDPIMGRGFAQMQICAAQYSDRLLLNGVAVAPGTPGATVNTATPTASTSCASGSPVITIGPDISRQTNALTSRTYGGSLLARLHRNGHDLKVFADFSDTRIFNAFLQRSAGDYYFDSITDFQAGNAQRLRYANSIPSLDPNASAANFGYQSYAFGIQDSWRITDTFNLSYGMRYDMYGGHSRAALNPNFVNRYGFANNAYISGRGVFQPRIGFDFKPVRNLSIRGGFGIFAGGAPDVYISNSFSNTGILTNSIDVRQNNNSTTYTGASNADGQTILTNVNGATINPAANTVLLNGTVASASSTNALSPNFKLPNQWRGTLSTDYRADLGGLGHWNFGADLFYSKVRQQVLFTDLRVTPNGLMTPDGRPRYALVAGIPASDTGSDLLLTNTTKGRSYVGVLRADVNWDFGLSAGASFTYQDIKDQAPATSSTASSNYANGAFSDPNIVQYGTSNDQVKYNIKYHLTFDHAFFGDYKTTFALFGETRIGHPYSFTFLDAATRSTVFGTIGSGSRYLLYVPNGASDPLVSYSNDADKTAILNYFSSVGLDKYAGKVAPRNAFHSAWFTRLDLHLAQEIPTFVGKSRITLFADIDNFTNLLNKNWGQIIEYAFPYNIAPVRVSCLTTAGNANGAGTVAASSGQACAQYRYSPATTSGGAFAAPSPTIYARQSLYAIRVGARFTF